MKVADYQQLRTRLYGSIWSLAPLAERIESEERLPGGVMPALRAMGAFALMIPEEYGGAGLTVSQYLPILAEFAKVHGAIRVLVHVHNSFAHALSELGTDAQKAGILPGASVGERSVAFALTEPDRGTGLDTGTTAIRDRDDYVINNGQCRRRKSRPRSRRRRPGEPSRRPGATIKRTREAGRATERVFRNANSCLTYFLNRTATSGTKARAGTSLQNGGCAYACRG